MSMKLAEALALRADLNKRMQQLRMRLQRNARAQEGDQPAEDPKALIAELEGVARDLESMIQRINRTNCATELEAGVSIADAIATRDLLASKNEIYRNLADAAAFTQDYRTKSEVRFYSTVSVSETQARVDELARQHRELDTRIQELNWKTDLL
jgi:N-methylhydantoinase B/oxoprolinase/acetone carboxylase alpha subunit